MRGFSTGCVLVVSYARNIMRRREIVGEMPRYELTMEWFKPTRLTDIRCVATSCW